MNNIGRMALTAIVVAGLICAGLVVMRRMSFERSHRQVEIILDMNDAQRFSQAVPGGLDEALSRFRDAGATTLGVYEENLSDIIDSGRATQISYFDYQAIKDKGEREWALPHDIMLSRATVASFRELGEAARYEGYMKSYFGADACPQTATCILPFTRRNLDEITLGFDLPKTGMAIALRPYNNFVETPDSIKMKFAQWDGLPNKSMMIFDGNAALGNPRLIKDVAAEIKARPDLPVGVVELSEQDGVDELSHRVADHVVSVHSITQKEMEVMKRDAAVSRLARAVRERKVQGLYLRLFARQNGLPPSAGLAYNIEYVKSVADAVRKAGKEIAIAKPIEEMRVSWVLRALTVAGAGALVLLLAGIVFRVSPVLSIACCAGLFFAYPVAMHLGKEALYLKLSALAVGSLAPGLATCAFFLTPYDHYDGPGQKLSIMKNISSWLAVCLLTSTAGVMIAAMLASRDFYLRLDLFAGVKVALVVPFLIVIYCFLKTSRVSLVEFFDSPVRYIEAAAAAVLLAGLAIYLIRSGNQAPAGAAGVAGGGAGGMEHSMRNWLEAVLVVRPRTKEFLIGHPAMILLGMLPFFRKNYGYLALLLVGVVGQAGILNTFCHLHTPFGMTAARVVIGILMGMIVGLSARIALLAGLRIIRPA